MIGLDNELNKISSKGVDGTSVTKLKGVIHYNGGSLTIHKLIKLQVDRNYNKNFCDYTTIETYMPLGNFVKHIYPSRDNLECSILQDRGGHKALDKYKCFVMNDNFSIENEMFKKASTEDLNVELAYVKFLLIERTAFMMNSIHVNLTVKDNNLENFITCIMRYDYDRIKIPGDRYKKGFSIIPPHNTKTYTHILLPTPLKILNLPSYLQRKEYGVYNGDCGTYIQTYDHHISRTKYESHRILWVYPLYNQSTEGRKKKKLKIYISKRKKDSEIERTYYIDASLSLRILATIKDDITIPNLKVKKNHGNKDTYMEAESVMNRSHIVTKDSSYRYTSDVIDNVVQVPMEDGENTMKYHGIIQNKFHYKSDNMRLNGYFMTVVWKFSVPDYLFPGMLVDIYWEEQIDNSRVIRSAKGVLQASNTIVEANHEMSVTVLIVFISEN